MSNTPLLRTTERKDFKRDALGHFLPGSDHPLWAGNRPSRQARHSRVERLRGRAKTHPCTYCSNRAHDWAQIHGTTGLDINDYMALCKKCHINYDNLGFRNGAHWLAKLTKDDIPIIRQRLANGERQRVIAADYGVHQVTISRVKLGKDWSWVS